MKILHVLANSPPDVNGYAVRTKMILESQQTLGKLECFALTSPWYPGRESMAEPFDTNLITYLRTLHPSRKSNAKFSHKLVRLFTPNSKGAVNKTPKEVVTKRPFIVRISDFFYFGMIKIGRAIKRFFRIGWKVIEEKILIKYFKQRIIEVARQTNAELIHAHTPYRVGLPALKAARELKLPFVYEMRGMWEETAVANKRWINNGPAYRRFKRFETRILRKADAVICISETLKKDAIARGVAAKKITVVTNAVEKGFVNGKQTSVNTENQISRLNIKASTTVVGYIGSLREMEGVDFTALGVSKLIDMGYDVRLFVLSDTPGQSELQEYCNQLGIGDKSLIMGPVPHENVGNYYELIDVFVVSRPNTRVTRLVTPLKPFEAMGMGKAIVASNLPALAEIIQHSKTGLLFESDNLESLVSILQNCIEDPNLCNELGIAAKNWILEHRTWDNVVKRTLEAYNIAMNK